MSDLNEYFREEDDWQGHPKLRFWDNRRQQTDVQEAKVEVLRAWDVLGFKPVKIYMHFFAKDGAEILCDSEDWDDDLHTGLVRIKIRAISKDNEKDRFALALRAALRKAENRFGDGYFNSVLIELIAASPFAEYPEVAEIVKHIQENRPYSNSTSYDDCRDMINYAIRGRAQELTKELSYSRQEAEEILAAAVARYLDERFSVTNRRCLGLL